MGQSGRRHLGTEASTIHARPASVCRLVAGFRSVPVSHVAMTGRRSIRTGVLDAWRNLDPGSVCQLFMLPSEKMAVLE